MEPRSVLPDRDAAIQFLLARIDYERTAPMQYDARSLGLDRMRALLQRLGNPQDQVAIVHVAGSKGKGSTAAMLAAILSAAGLRCGLFSSPHLERLEERIRVAGEPCGGEAFTALVNQLIPAVQELDAAGQSPTFFELTTALALLHFAEQQLPIAVLEVGLGGRLDATNVCTPRVAVITSISFDHMELLGNTLAEIAAEKGGIIKPGVPVVSGVQQPEPRGVIERIAAERGASLVQVDRDFTARYLTGANWRDEFPLGQVEWQWRGQPAETYELSLLGAHQAHNAAVALATVQVLRAQGFEISTSAVRQGLLQVVWPARVERIQRSPDVVIDGAHNVASVEALLVTLAERGNKGRRILVFATTRGKDVRGMLERLLPGFDRVILTRYQNNPRSVPLDLLEELAAELGRPADWGCETPRGAWQQVRGMAQAEDLIVVTGSLFIAGELRSIALANPLQCSGKSG